MTEEWSSLVSFRMGTNGFGETGALAWCKAQGEAMQGGVFIFPVKMASVPSQ